MATGQKNLYEINENYGTPEELIALVDECHRRDVWVMVDIVANHMAPLSTSSGGFADFIPFNDVSYYHTELDCGTIDWKNQTEVEICWLAELPDLDQDIPFVKEKLIEWIGELVAKYKFDGLRIDTVPYVSKEFWKEFTDASGVYTIGEVFNELLPYDAGYQGCIDAVLNYPLYYVMRDVFHQKKSMYRVESYYRDDFPGWIDSTLLGNFVDNHDNPRFLYENGDIIAFKSALAFAMTTVGIPITYYGGEQAYGGGADPENREPLWTNMDPHSDIYDFLAQINKFRKESKFYSLTQIQRYADDHFYVFSRGDFLFAFTNTRENQQRTITYHNYTEGTVLCNVFYARDCVTVQNGQFTVFLNNGEVKIFFPKEREVIIEKEPTAPIEVRPVEEGTQVNTANTAVYSLLRGAHPKVDEQSIMEFEMSLEKKQ